MFKPLNGRILVKPEGKKTETASGILIPDSATQDKPVSGVVVVGGVLVKEGDNVLFSKYGFDEVMIDDTVYNVVSETNVLGIF